MGKKITLRWEHTVQFEAVVEVPDGITVEEYMSTWDGGDTADLEDREDTTRAEFGTFDWREGESRTHRPTKEGS